jgi:hypothetical protein
MKEMIARVGDKIMQSGIWSVCLTSEELVRCKDCKHRDPEDGKCDSGHGIIWNLPRPDDWFCADGERKEGEVV